MRAPKLFIKPFLFMIVMFGVIATVTSFTSGLRLKRELTKEYKSKALALTQSIAESDIISILDNDAGSVQARIAQYQSIAGVAYVIITDAKGSIVAHTFTPTVPTVIKNIAVETPYSSLGEEYIMQDIFFNKAEYLHVARPVLSGLVGYVHIGMDSSVISENLRASAMEQQGIMLGIFSLCSLFMFFFFLNISKPLLSLAEYAGRVATKDFSDVPEIDSNDEVGQLAQAMRAMAWQISELLANLEARVAQKTQQLKEAHDILKNTVEERTTELQQANRQLKTEIAERKVIGETLIKTERKYRAIFENAVEGIYQTSPSGRFLSANPSFARIFGYESADEVMNSVYDLGMQMYIEPGRRQKLIETIKAQGQVKNAESKVRRKDGHIIWISENTRVIRDAAGKILCYEGSVEDITLRKKAEDQLRQQAFHDPLTGLPNRALFLDRLRKAMQRALRQKHIFAVIYMDLDRFKVINDSLGHETGDELLCAVARVLKDCARSMDTVARFGGDEFAILLEEITSSRDAIAIARRILKGINIPIHIRGHEVFTSASLGIVLNTDGYSRPEALLRDADTAMYRAKETGKSRFKVFNQKMHDQALKLMALETDLRRAVDLHEFEVVYQPVISLERREIKGFEALIRWHHPEYGYISPSNFIPLAEDTGLIYAIDKMVVTEACTQVRQWQLQFGEKLSHRLKLNINISGKHFGKAVLPAQIAKILTKSDLPPTDLNIEITESALIDNPTIAEDILNKIKEIGANICIDDFGTGYSSLAYLQRFPIDIVKVDRSFIDDVEGNPDSQAIVRTIFSLGKSLGLEIVAEGVENNEQLAFLEKEGCRYVQGFLFYKPLSKEKVEVLLAKETPW